MSVSRGHASGRSDFLTLIRLAGMEFVSVVGSVMVSPKRQICRSVAPVSEYGERLAS